MIVLVLNSGSSSLKYKLFDMSNQTLVASGLVERIGVPGGRAVLKHQTEGKPSHVVEQHIGDHREALGLVLRILQHPSHGAVGSLEEISAVGHRVLHGGEVFTDSIIVDDHSMALLKELVPLGPLHMPANIMGIEACATLMPGVPQIAVFDTAFHQTMPKHAYTYAIPYEYYEDFAIRKYGFHGTSHKYVSAKAAEVLGLDFHSIKMVTCHLGNGCSLAAVSNGECVDTTMGLTPLEGLAMGTRSGDIDPAVIPVLCDKLKLSADDVVNILNKKSGLLGISGFSSDMRDIQSAKDQGNERAQLAYDVFVNRLVKYIGSYFVAMGGLDVLVFTGGIGENDAATRAVVCQHIECLGAKVDYDLNGLPSTRGKRTVLSLPDSAIAVILLPTNEELMIAQDTAGLIAKG